MPLGLLANGVLRKSCGGLGIGLGKGVEMGGWSELEGEKEGGGGQRRAQQRRGGGGEGVIDGRTIHLSFKHVHAMPNVSSERV